MHQPMNRAHRVVADRVVALVGVADELARVGHELAGDRVGGIAGLNQRGQRRRDGDRIAPGDSLKLREPFRAGEPRVDQGSRGGEAVKRSLDGHASGRVGDGRGRIGSEADLVRTVGVEPAQARGRGTFLRQRATLTKC